MLVVVRHLRRQEGVRGGAEAEQHRLDDRGAVDCVGDRAAHVHVLQRGIKLVHLEVVGPRRGEERHRDAGRLLQLVDRVEGRELVDLNLAAS